MEQRNKVWILGGAAILAAILIARLVMIWISNAEIFIASLPDDAWYYTSIARHIAAGTGSTFDGIHPTNGYHPLWMIVLSTLRMVTGAVDVLLLARLVATLQLLLGACAATMHALLCWRVLRSAAATAVLLALHATPFVVYGMTDGMESGLLQLALAGIFWGAIAFKPFTGELTPRVFAFGAIVSLAVLARLDVGLLAVALTCVALPTQSGARRAMVIAFPCAIMIPLYLFMNAMHFDSLLPISARLKSTFPDFHFNGIALRTHIIPICAGLMTIAMTAVNSRRVTDRDLRLVMRGGAIFLALHLIHTIFFTHWGIQRWHFTAYWPLLLWQLILTPRIIARAGYVLPAIALVSIASQVSFFWKRTERAFQVQSYRAALWARENIPAGRLIGMSDCGTFGAFYGDGVINLDGVVNNAAYQTALKEKGIRGYANDVGISYIAHHAVIEADSGAKKTDGALPPYEYAAHSHLGGEQHTSTLALRPLDEVYRAEPYNDGTGKPKVFVIWKRRRELSPHNFSGGSKSYMP